MAAGLPCIASIHVGATFDLIEDGINGFAMDFSATEQIATKINLILENKALAEEIGKNANNFIKKNAILKMSAEGLVKAIQAL